MSRRLKITLPDPVCEQLSDMAANSGEPVSRLAAEIVRNRVIGTDETVPGLCRQRRITASQRPEWLEPLSDDGRWRTLMWEKIEALYLRYRHALSCLADGWWEDESCVETLCALATWRRSIDESGHDPIEELDFQARLAECSTAFQRAAGAGVRSWLPGARPRDWDQRPGRTPVLIGSAQSLATHADLAACAS
jgi:hypothetical protein